MLFIVTSVFPSFNVPLVAFNFLPTRHLLINTWSLKLIQPIITSLYVPCIATWKHFTSSLWMNAANFIFWLFHIVNIPLLTILTPPCSPCTPSVDYVNSFIDYIHPFANCDHTLIDCISFFANCANKSNDYAKNLDVWAYTIVDLVNTFDKSSLDLCIPNPLLLQLLLTDLLVIYRSKINIVLIVESSICSSSFVPCI